MSRSKENIALSFQLRKRSIVFECEMFPVSVKGYLLISLKGDYSNLVAEEVSVIRGIACVSLVTGSIDILSSCLFKETNDLFKIIGSVKTIERVDKVAWVEEVHNIPSKEIMVFRSLVQESIKTSSIIQDNNTNGSLKETAT